MFILNRKGDEKILKVLFFDLDDTLLWDKKSVKETFRNVCLEAEEETGIDHQLLEETARKEASDLYASYDTYPFTKMIGINPFEGLWGDFNDNINIGFRHMHNMIYEYQEQTWINTLKKLHVTDDSLGKKLAMRFRYHRRKLPFVYPETFEVLAALKKEYRLLLLTNGAPSLQQEKLEMTPQLVPFFEHILISGAFGVGKPDPSIFKHALNLMNCNAEEVIMIGDNLNTDISGSNKANIKNIWINHDQSPSNGNIPFTWEVNALSEIRELLLK